MGSPVKSRDAHSSIAATAATFVGYHQNHVTLNPSVTIRRARPYVSGTTSVCQFLGSMVMRRIWTCPGISPGPRERLPPRAALPLLAYIDSPAYDGDTNQKTRNQWHAKARQSEWSKENNPSHQFTSGRKVTAEAKLPCKSARRLQKPRKITGKKNRNDAVRYVLITGGRVWEVG